MALVDYGSMKVTVPEGESGDWKVERFTVSEEEAEWSRIRASIGREGGRWCPAGEYTRLQRGRTTVMSDTPDEMRDHWEPIHRATGVCLVNGLGLGMVVSAMLEKPEVERVDVVEFSDDVISLVADHYTSMYGDRLNIIHADALEYRPARGQRYDVVWHDIWDNICSDNLDEMKVLHRAYGRRSEWQGSWCRAMCQHLIRTGW